MLIKLFNTHQNITLLAQLIKWNKLQDSVGIRMGCPHGKYMKIQHGNWKIPKIRNAETDTVWALTQSTFFYIGHECEAWVLLHWSKNKIVSNFCWENSILFRKIISRFKIQETFFFALKSKQNQWAIDQELQNATKNKKGCSNCYCLARVCSSVSTTTMFLAAASSWTIEMTLCNYKLLIVISALQR